MRLIASVWAASATLAAPALRLMLRRRAARGKEQRDRLPERWGADASPRPAGRLLWLHAASVGESMSALKLVAALPADISILFTTGTRTSASLLAARLPELGLADRVWHRYVPLDVPAWVARFLDHWRPDAACFIESELWPNLLAACRRRGVPTALVNARLSARSAALWGRVPRFSRAMFAGFSFIAARSQADADRLAKLGANDVLVWGDLKWSADPLPADPAEFLSMSAHLGDGPRWLAASTHPADEAVVREAHELLAARHPGLLTAIAPRHPERGAALAGELAATRRSAGEQPPRGGGFWVADTMGELGLLYRCFPIVLVGKGFGAGGGQNPWEPAQLGCALATGPATGNFDDAVRTLAEAGALTVVIDAPALAAWVDTMLTDPEACAGMGRAAREATIGAHDVAPRLAARLLALMDARCTA